MKFYIVTPSFRSLTWLPRCVRSVADQANEWIEIHHHVQDGGSEDGTVQWLESWSSKVRDIPGYRFSFSSERDGGMYDAINRAWDLLPEDADVTAHLNSDEQYLPGTLKQVAQMFELRRRSDILLGTYIVVDRQNKYVCHRRPVMPRACLSWLNCACITNSSFYRASFFRQKQPRFDTSWRNIGDLVFFHQLAEEKVSFSTIPDVVTSAFVCTGENLAWTASAIEERARWESEVPRALVILNGLIYRWVNLTRIAVDFFCTAPREYFIYDADEEIRRHHSITHPTPLWNASSRNASRSAGGTIS